MSKNLTRKGLAFGAVVALGSTLIAGSPAFAAGEVSLAPKAGTAYSLISGETFTLSAFAGATIPSSSWGSLKTKVTNNSAIAFTTGATQSNVNFAGTGAQASTVASVVLEAASYVTGGSTAPTAGTADVTLAVAATAAGNFSVQSFLDSNGNDAIDDGEFSSAVRTVTFVKVADVVATTAITAPTENDTNITAKVSFVGINNEQIPAANVGAVFTKGDGTALTLTTYANASITSFAQATTLVTYQAANTFVAGQIVTVTGLTTAAFNFASRAIVSATATSFTVGGFTSATVATTTEAGTAAVAASSAVKSNVVWSTTDSFKYTSDAVSVLVKATAVKVQPLYKLAGAPAATDTIGTATSATVSTRKASSIVASVVAGNTALAGASAHVLLNSTFSMKALVKDTTAVTPVALAAASTSVTVTSSATLSSTKTLSVNGVVYTDNAKLPGTSSTYPALVVATNATGEAVVSFTTVGFVADETVVASFVVENLSASVATATSKAAAYTGHVTNATTGLSVTDGAAAVLNVAVYDQFGNVPADNWDARAVWASSTQGDPSTANVNRSTTASSTVAAIVAGKATLSITDNGTGTGLNVYNVTFAKRIAGGGYSDDTTINATFPINIVTAANLTAGVITATGTLNATTKIYENTGGIALNLNTTGNYDYRAVQGTIPTVAGGLAISGAVTTLATASAVAVGIVGAPLTISGAGLQFKNTANNRFAVDSITVATGAAGAYDVTVYSNKAGVQTLTLTSGGVSQLVTVKFNAAGNATGTTLVIDAPASILPGRTLEVTVSLVDKYGNPVAAVGTGLTGDTAPAATIVYDGPGLIVNTITQAFDATGKSKFRVLMGANEIGSAKITATYDLDGATATATVLTATKTVAIAAAAAVVAKTAVIATKNGRVYVTVNSPAGFKSYVKVGFSVKPAFTTTGSKLVSYFVGAGKRVAVVVYVRGGKVASQAITIK